ncbi:MAG: DUF2933 domain-containing protein [Acidobacteriota bacterium]|nr:DUF2933 domain-containing protein [Acidobacteriota bacterium]
MAWLTENWFWLLVFVGFIAMHVFGHGGHGGHLSHGGGDRQRNRDEKDVARGRAVTTTAIGHRH